MGVELQSVERIVTLGVIFKKFIVVDSSQVTSKLNAFQGKDLPLHQSQDGGQNRPGTGFQLRV